MHVLMHTKVCATLSFAADKARRRYILSGTKAWANIHVCKVCICPTFKSNAFLL